MVLPLPEGLLVQSFSECRELSKGLDKASLPWCSVFAVASV